ncbi:MAG: metallophosphoesterase [Gemmataceae bacterium]
MQWNQWLLTPQRVAVDAQRAIAVVADLHLGYDRIRQRGGEAIPVPSIADELAPLARVVRSHAVREIVVAGDLFEEGRCARAEMEEALLAWGTEHGIRWRVVPGNHDRGLADSRLEVVARVCIGDWQIVHGDSPATIDGKIVQGHEHPWLRWRPGVEGPCYLLSDTHLILPAYSVNAAGGNVLGCLRWRAYRAAVIAGDSVLDFGPLKGA